MRVKVNFFKPGKWGYDETFEIPEGAHAWDFRKYLPRDRFTDLIAVTEGETPWGYPAISIPDDFCEAWDRHRG